MNNELLEALTVLEKEKDISKETMLEAIENSLLTACKNHFGKSDNIKVVMNHDTCEYKVIAEKTVVEAVEDDVMEMKNIHRTGRPNIDFMALRRAWVGYRMKIYIYDELYYER